MTPKRDITVAYLKKLYACPDQVAIFKREWPDGVDVTEAAVLRAAELRLDLHWFALQIYGRAGPLYEEYMRQCAPLWAEYEREHASFYEEYERQGATFAAEYERQRALRRAEYERQHAPLFFSCWQKMQVKA